MSTSLNPPNWPTLRLGDVAEFQNGGAWKADEYSEAGVRVVQVTNCQDGTINMNNCKHISVECYNKYSKYELRTNDLVTATVGSHPTQPGSVVGRTSVVPPGAAGALLNQNAVRLRAMLQVIDQSFLNHFSKTTEFRNYIIAHARGAANQVRMSIELLKEMPVPLPPLPTQRRIASILSAYDDLIENNTRRIAILEEMARRLYDEWFVKFRFPGHEESGFEETEQGPIPDGWNWLLLKDCIELCYGKALKAADRVEGSFPVYGSSGVVGSHDKYLVEGPGLVVGRKGNVGSVHWSTESFYPIDTTYFVRTDLPLEYVYHNLLQQNFLNNDAAVPGLNREQAYSLPFLIPSPHILNLYVDQCRPLLALAKLLNRVNENLRAQRDLLLPKLISGEIDVSQAERQGEEL